MFTKWQVSTRLGVGFGVALIASISIGGTAMHYLEKLSDCTAKLYQHPFTVSTAILRVHRDVLQIHSHMLGGALSQAPASHQQTSREIHQLGASIAKDLTLVEERFLGEQGKVRDLQELFAAWAPVRQEIATLIASGNTEQALLLTKEKGASYTAALEAQIAEIASYAAQKAQAFQKQAEAARDQAFAIFFLVFGGSLCGIFLMASIVSQSITRPLGGRPEEISALVSHLAKGDLSIHLTDTGAEKGIYAAVRDMVAQLRKMVSQVVQATGHVTLSAREIAQGSADLARRTEAQASALEETASAMEQLTSTIQQSADNATHASQLANTARMQAEQGGRVVEQVAKAMSAINEGSDRISNIIGVIDEIAFQTNLLALNAAVEAARAGEQGRGFAVVASEVRKLAQRSAGAAKEIKTLIADSVQRVEEGEKLVCHSGETLREIVAAAKKASEIVAEMAVATREQASGIDQVNQAITQMDKATQQNATLVEQTAAASQAMNKQAVQLQELMGFFTLSRHTYAHHAAPSTHLSFERCPARVFVGQAPDTTEPRGCT